MIQFGDAYRGRRVLLTGHTGFKGSWLALWLTQLGAHVTGIALDPATPDSHWDLLKLDIVDHRQDIREAKAMTALVTAARPEIVFHLAAQPLVRRSYQEPLETWATNVMGTAHVLEACRQVDGVKAIVAVTTDKVYANQEWVWGYREHDRLGGRDPYSASKAASELVIDSYRRALLTRVDSPRLASARAGNVIGGGDWSEDRLIPDCVRSIRGRGPMIVRSPQSTRPWQHVLDCLAGYLRLGQLLCEGHAGFDEAWNFGPDPNDNRTVADILGRMQMLWPDLAWQTTREAQPHEATLLYLDHAKARNRLAWEPVWRLDRALEATVEWYRQFLATGTVVSERQLADYVEAACAANVSWVSA